MAKKKIYKPPNESDWDEAETKEHRRIIAEEKSITKKYKRWWDKKRGSWKEGFDGHAFVE